ncbi:MAG: tRNA 2-thiouridine(34) synthase MnmA [Candidatus Aminicenantes bacterium]|nr:tRNA 2-thiouridine(34) synthase MnmA [Candidatus Aminicenantes bacterium]
MNRKKERVLVAMSGGVDSSVAAALLKEQGYEVIGVTMDIFDFKKWPYKEAGDRNYYGQSGIESANQVVEILGIQHYLVDVKKLFEKKVIDGFCMEYAQGRTPNPCIRCNRYIKFDVLMKKAEELCAQFMATGHYARVIYDSPKKLYILKMGRDREKDQSYFLYLLTQEQLSRTLMPIGDYTKEEIRQKAVAMGLPVAERPESQEICFIPDNDYTRFLKERIPQAFRPGPIVDTKGKVLGTHEGIICFTIGQRRGLGIAASYPLYVIEIQSATNTVVVGTNELLYKKKLLASNVNFILPGFTKKTMIIKAKIRYKHKAAEACLTPLQTGGVQVEFKRPQRAVTPGQAVVFYMDDTVIGGGAIEKTIF